MLAGPQIIEAIRRDPKIPAPSQAISRILDMTRSPDCDIKRLAAVIARDGGLTAQLLRQANSALYGFNAPTSSAADACTRLGLKHVRAAVINQHIVSGLGKARPPGFDAARYWQAAFAASVAARDLCGQITPASAEEAGTAGLLCDIGVGLMAFGIPAEYRGVLAQWTSHSDADLVRIERRMLGVHHAEVGAAVLADWRLDPHIVDAVRNHHADPMNPDDAEISPFARIIAASVTLSQLALEGSDMEKVSVLFAHMETLTPDADAVVARLLDSLVCHIQESAESFSVELGPLDNMEGNFAELLRTMPDVSARMTTRPMEPERVVD